MWLDRVHQGRFIWLPVATSTFIHVHRNTICLRRHADDGMVHTYVKGYVAAVKWPA